MPTRDLAPAFLGPGIGAPIIGRPTVNLRGVERAFFVGSPRIGTPVVGASDITADLMDPSDPATVVAALPLTKGRSWLEQLSDAGRGSITFQNDDPALASVSEGSLIRFSLKGVPAVVMVCETTDADLFDPAEESAETTTWNGGLHVTLTDRAAVYPSRGVGQKPVQENRNFDYTAPEYDDRGWVGVWVLGEFSAAMAYWYTSAWPGQLFRLTYPRFFDFINAAGFPDFSAPLLGVPGATLRRGRPLPADSGGDAYFRQQVNIAADGSYEPHIIGDDQLELAIDGVQVATTGAGFLATGQGAVDLTAGWHTFAWHVNGKRDDQGGPGASVFGAPYDPTFNPTLGTWTLIQPAAFGRSQTIIARADSSAKTSGYVTQIPGMTPGRAFRLVNDEAAARGVLVPALGFSDKADSAGLPWETFAISTRVGNDNFSFLREMSVAYIDFAMRVGTFTLDMWRLGGRGSTRSIALRPPTDPTDPDTGTLHHLARKGESQ